MNPSFRTHRLHRPSDTPALDTPPASPEPWWQQAGLAFPDLRTVLVHVLVETATHAGHLDAARELIDGTQYLVLD